MFELQLAVDIYARGKAVPDGTVNVTELCTSLAWDNYDENTGTLSGKGTLNGKVVICYQNITTITQSNASGTIAVHGPDRSPFLYTRGFKMNVAQLEPYIVQSM